MLTDTEARIIPLRRNRDAEQARTLRGQVPLAGRRALTARLRQPGSVVVRETSCGKQGCRCQADPPRRKGLLPVEPSSEGQDRERRLTENEAELYDRGSTTGDASRRSSLRWRRSQPQLARYFSVKRHIRRSTPRSGDQEKWGAKSSSRSAERRLDSSRVLLFVRSSHGVRRARAMTAMSVPTPSIARSAQDSAAISATSPPREPPAKRKVRTTSRSSSHGLRTGTWALR